METLNNLSIAGTKTAPQIEFNADGHLKIEGRFLPDNAALVFKPLFDWIMNLDVEKIEFDINLEYINTSASMHLFSLLRKLEEKCHINELIVNWYFEEDDEDHYDTGVFFEEKLDRTLFYYKEVA